MFGKANWMEKYTVNSEQVFSRRLAPIFVLSGGTSPSTNEGTPLLGDFGISPVVTIPPSCCGIVQQ